MPRPSSPVISLSHVEFATPDGTSLLNGPIDVTFGTDRTGLVGRNGIGKSTLLRVIAGEAKPQSGNIERKGTVAMLRQSVQVGGDTLADVLGVREALETLARLERGDGTPADVDAADWTMEGRLETALASVGLAGIPPSRPLSSLSGGQRTRAAFAALILADADLVLLDEPTNNMDVEGRDIVTEFLTGWRKGALVVSHDRALLELMDRIVELSDLGVRVYGGGYAFYEARRTEERAAAERMLDVRKREVDTTERRIQQARERQDRKSGRGERSRKRGDQPKMLFDARQERAEKTKSGATALADRQRAAAAQALSDAEADVERVKLMQLELPRVALPAGRNVLQFERVEFSYADGAEVLSGIDFIMTGPERVALVGANGSGKSTFLRLAAGLLEPTDGTVRRPVENVLLDQSVALLDPGASLFDNYRHLNPAADTNRAHAVLAQFQFRNSDAGKLAGALSGGETLRAGLACTLGSAEPPSLLIVDEPTNHLDLDSIRAVEAALAAFDGALLVASHDAVFLEAIGVDRSLVFPL